MDDKNDSQFDDVAGNLGNNNPLLPAEPLSKSQRIIPQFIVPLGARSLSILDTSIFRFQEPETDSNDTMFRDSPFFADYGQVKGVGGVEGVEGVNTKFISTSSSSPSSPTPSSSASDRIQAKSQSNNDIQSDSKLIVSNITKENSPDVEKTTIQLTKEGKSGKAIQSPTESLVNNQLVSNQLQNQSISLTNNIDNIASVITNASILNKSDNLQDVEQETSTSNNLILPTVSNDTEINTLLENTKFPVLELQENQKDAVQLKIESNNENSPLNISNDNSIGNKSKLINNALTFVQSKSEIPSSSSSESNTSQPFLQNPDIQDKTDKLSLQSLNQSIIIQPSLEVNNQQIGENLSSVQLTNIDTDLTSLETTIVQPVLEVENQDFINSAIYLKPITDSQKYTDTSNQPLREISNVEDNPKSLQIASDTDIKNLNTIESEILQSPANIENQNYSASSNLSPVQLKNDSTLVNNLKITPIQAKVESTNQFLNTEITNHQSLNNPAFVKLLNDSAPVNEVENHKEGNAIQATPQVINLQKSGNNSLKSDVSLNTETPTNTSFQTDFTQTNNSSDFFNSISIHVAKVPTDANIDSATQLQLQITNNSEVSNIPSIQLTGDDISLNHSNNAETYNLQAKTQVTNLESGNITNLQPLFETKIQAANSTSQSKDDSDDLLQVENQPTTINNIKSELRSQGNTEDYSAIDKWTTIQRANDSILSNNGITGTEKTVEVSNYEHKIKYTSETSNKLTDKGEYFEVYNNFDIKDNQFIQAFAEPVFNLPVQEQVLEVDTDDINIQQSLKPIVQNIQKSELPTPESTENTIKLEQNQAKIVLNNQQVNIANGIISSKDNENISDIYTPRTESNPLILNTVTPDIANTTTFDNQSLIVNAKIDSSLSENQIIKQSNDSDVTIPLSIQTANNNLDLKSIENTKSEIIQPNNNIVIKNSPDTQIQKYVVKGDTTFDFNKIQQTSTTQDIYPIVEAQNNQVIQSQQNPLDLVTTDYNLELTDSSTQANQQSLQITHIPQETLKIQASDFNKTTNNFTNPNNQLLLNLEPDSILENEKTGNITSPISGQSNSELDADIDIPSVINQVDTSILQMSQPTETEVNAIEQKSNIRNFNQSNLEFTEAIKSIPTVTSSPTAVEIPLNNLQSTEITAAIQTKPNNQNFHQESTTSISPIIDAVSHKATATENLIEDLTSNNIQLAKNQLDVPDSKLQRHEIDSGTTWNTQNDLKIVDPNINYSNSSQFEEITDSKIADDQALNTNLPSPENQIQASTSVLNSGASVNQNQQQVPIEGYLLDNQQLHNFSNTQPKIDNQINNTSFNVDTTEIENITDSSTNIIQAASITDNLSINREVISQINTENPVPQDNQMLTNEVSIAGTTLTNSHNANSIISTIQLKDNLDNSQNLKVDNISVENIDNASVENTVLGLDAANTSFDIQTSIQRQLNTDIAPEPLTIVLPNTTITNNSSTQSQTNAKSPLLPLSGKNFTDTPTNSKIIQLLGINDNTSTGDTGIPTQHQPINYLNIETQNIISSDLTTNNSASEAKFSNKNQFQQSNQSEIASSNTDIQLSSVDLSNIVDANTEVSIQTQSNSNSLNIEPPSIVSPVTTTTVITDSFLNESKTTITSPQVLVNKFDSPQLAQASLLSSNKSNTGELVSNVIKLPVENIGTTIQPQLYLDTNNSNIESQNIIPFSTAQNSVESQGTNNIANVQTSISSPQVLENQLEPQQLSNQASISSDNNIAPIPDIQPVINPEISIQRQLDINNLASEVPSIISPITNNLANVQTSISSPQVLENQLEPQQLSNQASISSDNNIAPTPDIQPVINPEISIQRQLDTNNLASEVPSIISAITNNIANVQTSISSPQVLENQLEPQQLSNQASISSDNNIAPIPDIQPVINPEISIQRQLDINNLASEVPSIISPITNNLANVQTSISSPQVLENQLEPQQLSNQSSILSDNNIAPTPDIQPVINPEISIQRQLDTNNLASEVPSIISAITNNLANVQTSISSPQVLENQLEPQQLSNQASISSDNNIAPTPDIQPVINPETSIQRQLDLDTDNSNAESQNILPVSITYTSTAGLQASTQSPQVLINSSEHQQLTSQESMLAPNNFNSVQLPELDVSNTSDTKISIQRQSNTANSSSKAQIFTNPESTISTPNQNLEPENTIASPENLERKLNQPTQVILTNSQSVQLSQPTEITYDNSESVQWSQPTEVTYGNSDSVQLSSDVINPIATNLETSIQRQVNTENLINEAKSVIQSEPQANITISNAIIPTEKSLISSTLPTDSPLSSETTAIQRTPLTDTPIADEDITANTSVFNKLNQLNNIPQVPQVLQKLGVINSLTPSTSLTSPTPSTNKWSSFTDLVQGQTTPVRRKSNNNVVNNGTANTMVQAKFERTSPSIQSQAADSELVTVGNSQSATDVSESLETLAKAIYEKLRQRLRIDQERHGRGYTGRLPW